MPKGVVWRHEDIFFGAFGGGGAAAHRGAGRAGRAGRHGAGPALLPACPFMHGAAHWMGLSTLFTGGSIVLDDGAGFDPARIWQLVARSG